MTTAKPERGGTGGAALRAGVTDAIVAAVFAELAATGYARMSMEAVARRAGVGKAALYRRWSSKEDMLTDLIGQAVRDALPPVPDTGALHSDLREAFGNLRDQLSDAAVSRIGIGLLAEAVHNPAFEQALQREVGVPRRAAARRLLTAAIDRGELPADLDLEFGADLLVAPVALRMLVLGGAADDAYLDMVTNATEAALRCARPA